MALTKEEYTELQKMREGLDNPATRGNYTLDAVNVFTELYDVHGVMMTPSGKLYMMSTPLNLSTIKRTTKYKNNLLLSRFCRVIEWRVRRGVDSVDERVYTVNFDLETNSSMSMMECIRYVSMCGCYVPKSFNLDGGSLIPDEEYKSWTMEAKMYESRVRCMFERWGYIVRSYSDKTKDYLGYL